MPEDAETTVTARDGDGDRASTVRLAVPEMDCPSCATKVETSLGRVEGVAESRLRPTTGSATVTYDPARATERDVVAAIEGAGYAVADRNGDDDRGHEIAAPSAVLTGPRAVTTWIGAAALTAGLLVEFLLAGLNPEVAVVLVSPLRLSDALFLAAVAVSGTPVVRAE